MDFLSNEEDGGDEDGQRLLLIFSMNQQQQQIQVMPPHQLPVPGDVHRPNMANDQPHQPMTDVAASNPYFHFSDHPQQGLNSTVGAPAAETTTTTHHHLPHSLSTPPPPNNEHIKSCAGRRRVGSAEPTSAGNVHSEPAVSSSSSSFACCRGCGLEIRDRHLLCLNGRRRQNVADPTIMASEVDGNNNDNSSHEEQPSSMPAGGHVKEEEGQEQEDCWHELCLRCAHCGLQLGPATGSCFVRHGRVYCREDHAKLFGRSPQCSRCAIPIGAHELVFRSAGGHVYHAQCFQCCCCGQPLAKGDQYLNVDGQLVCQRDFGLWQLQQQLTMSAAGHHKFGLPPPPGIVLGPTDQSPAGGPRFLPLPHFPELDFSLVHHQRPNFSHHLHHHHGERSKKVPKRPRTILNAPQRKAFKLAFEKGPKPSRKVREQLARETGLSVRVVQVWFQNQRAKMKKERKREMDKQQQQPNGNNGSSLGGGPVSNDGTDSDGGGGGGCFKEGDMDSQLFGSSSLRSPQSGSTGGKSEMLADDESDMDPEDGEEEEEGEEDSMPASCNSSGLVMAAAGLAAAQMPNGIGGGMCPPQMMDANGMSLVGGQQQQQNPIEKLYNMHQTYFAFV